MTEPSDQSKTPRVKIATTATGRIAWAVAGHCFVVLGIIGAFLPVMPTTVFLIVAASCYARSSEKLYWWLMNHRIFGRVLRDWVEHRSMRLRPKIIALVMIVIAFGTSFFAIPIPWVRVVHLSIGALLVAWIVRIPIRKAAESA